MAECSGYTLRATAHPATGFHSMLRGFLAIGPARYLCRCAAAALLIFSTSCNTFEESGLPGSASSMARNQIMLVMADPESFGHYRLVSLMRNYPDMGLFCANHGLPEFLAETNNGRQHYFILYYPAKLQAYAARTRAPNRQRLEFAGPYPITQSEKRTLDELRTKERAKLPKPQSR
jgi:hypothetical protein